MKATITKRDEVFQPVTVEFKFQTKAELQALFTLLNSNRVNKALKAVFRTQPGYEEIPWGDIQDIANVDTAALEGAIKKEFAQ